MTSVGKPFGLDTSYPMGKNSHLNRVSGSGITHQGGCVNASSLHESPARGSALHAARRDRDGRGSLAQLVTRHGDRTTSASSTRARGCSRPTARSTSRASSSGSSTRPRAPARSTARSQPHLVDDEGDPATAVSAAKDLIGQGYKIIAGHRLLGRRAPGGAARGAEPGALHLRARRPPTRSPASTSTRSAPAARPTRMSLTAASYLGRPPARRSSCSPRTPSSATATTPRSRP